MTTEPKTEGAAARNSWMTPEVVKALWRSWQFTPGDSYLWIEKHLAAALPDLVLREGLERERDWTATTCAQLRDAEREVATLRARVAELEAVIAGEPERFAAHARRLAASVEELTDEEVEEFVSVFYNARKGPGENTPQWVLDGMRRVLARAATFATKTAGTFHGVPIVSDPSVPKGVLWSPTATAAPTDLAALVKAVEEVRAHAMHLVAQHERVGALATATASLVA